MTEKIRNYKYGLFWLILLCLPIFANGQDLGSSSKIFGDPKTKSSSKTTAKKSTARSRVAAKKRVPAKSGNAGKTAKKTGKGKTNKNNQSDTQTADKNPLSEPSKNSVVITVGDPKNNADELFEKAINEGNDARDRREYTKAEAAYLRAQTIKTKDSRAVFGLGNLYSDQQRWEEAERAYRAAMEIEPDAAESYIALSFVLTQPILGANLADRYVEAEKLARQAIKLDPTNPLAYDQLGVALELGGKISQETQNSYRKAIELEPKFALAYAHLGRLLRRNGSTSDSTSAYRRAIEFSNDVPTMIMVADVMQSQQKYLESEQLLRRALKEDDKNPTALYLLGRALTTRGNYEEAEKVLKKSAEVSPNSFVSYILLASMSVRREKLDDAEKYLTKAVNVVSPNEKKRLAQEFEAVGDAYLKNGKSKDATRVFLQAAALDKERTSLSEKLARAQAN